MKFAEILPILKRLFKDYVRKYFKRLILALVLSIVVAGSTAGIAWLLDPAVKKIFIDQDRTYSYLIPFAINSFFCKRSFIILCKNKCY